MKENRILVIIPAYNEELSITKTLRMLKQWCPKYDCIVVNDCSSDNTLEVLRESKTKYLSLPTNLGIGGAVQCGYKYAALNDYDIAIQMDGDGQHDPKYYPQAVEMLNNGEADIIIGSRFIEKEGFQTSFMRRLGIRFLSWLIYITCEEKVRDVTSGFRIVNKEYIAFYAQEYAQDFPEPEAIIAAKLNGGRIKEIPVTMKERTEGESSISVLKSILYMVKVSLAIVFYRITR